MNPAKSVSVAECIRHFKQCMADYQRHRVENHGVGRFRYENKPEAVRDPVLPLPSDFVADVELACKHALRFHPVLWRLFSAIWIERRCSPSTVRDKFSKLYRTIECRCGSELLKRIPRVADYFNLTHAQQEQREITAREALEEARKANERGQKLAERQRKLRLAKRNKRRRERYAESKAEEGENESRKLVDERKAA